MKVRGKYLLIPAVALLLSGCSCSSNKKQNNSENNGIVNNNSDPAQIGSKQDAYNYGNKVTEEICEEGMILLKNENNALPLRKNTKVSVFGKNSVNLVYGGSGSSVLNEDITKTTILDSLTAT